MNTTFAVRRLCREIEPAYAAPSGVLVDLSAVTYIDVTCANELIKLSETRTALAHVPTSLVIPDETTRELFALLGVDDRSISTRRTVKRRRRTNLSA